MRRARAVLVAAIALVAAVLVPVGPGIGRRRGHPGVRPDRRRPVFDAVPEQLLHGRRTRRSPTGRRVHFHAPRCRRTRTACRSTRPTGTGSDGFSPGSDDHGAGPGIDLAKTGVATDHRHRRLALGRRADRAATTRHEQQRVPYWAELDTWNADRSDRGARDPARAQLRRGSPHRRRTAQHEGRGFGTLLPRRRASRRSATTRPITDPALLARRPSMQQVLTELATAGVARANALYLAWDFTVASEQGSRGRDAAHARRRVRAARRRCCPAVHVTQRRRQRERATRCGACDGTFDVPLYLTNGRSPVGASCSAPTDCRCAAERSTPSSAA